MGNRAYVVFESGNERSPAIYLHWQGGPESIYAFLHALRAVILGGAREPTEESGAAGKPSSVQDDEPRSRGEHPEGELE
jgi:hypothetical protein